MKILIISGSPRKHKTDYMLNKLADGLEHSETEFIKLSGHQINSCLSCRECIKKPFLCQQKDDFALLREKMSGADLIIFGSPAYFDNVSATLKNFFDRCLGLYWSEALKGKKAVLISVCGGTRVESVERTITSMEYFCDLMKMEIIGKVGAVDDEKSKDKELLEIAKALNLLS
ncbi:MAG: flavodoxin family protein [Candidatus Berkelbacteria bacterium]